MPGGVRGGVGDRLTAAVPILTLGVGLLALFLGYGWFWIVFVVGFAVLTPLVAVLFGSSPEESDVDEWTTSTREPVGAGTNAGEPGTRQEALDTVRDRYARGELSEVEFERKLERLLATETLEDARREAARSATQEGERSDDRDRGERSDDPGAGRADDRGEREFDYERASDDER